jgi:hypothetical protein
MIKRFLILIIFVSICIISTAQNISQNDYKNIVENKYENQIITLVDKTGFVYEWGICGTVCYGCASHYTKIMRTKYAANGLYAYYIFFYSNSYNGYGYLTGTYLKGIMYIK